MAVTTERRAPAAAEGRRRPLLRRGLSFEGKMLSPALIILALVSIFPFIYIIIMTFGIAIALAIYEMRRGRKHGHLAGADADRGHDRDGEPVHAHPQGKGAGTMTTARGGVGSRIGLPVLLGVILVWTVVPLAWMVLSSFKPADELTTSTPTLMFEPTLEHYDALFSGGNNIGTIVVAPMILVGLIVRKWLVTGLTLGAVTGE